MPNQPQTPVRIGATVTSGSASTAPVGSTFKDLSGRLVTLSPEVPPGYPANTPGSGFIGSRRRSWTEDNQQCMLYAYSAGAKRVQTFNYFHFARVEGTTSDGREKVYSWVSGTPDTQAGTGHFVVYSTMNYLRLCGFRPR